MKEQIEVKESDAADRDYSQVSQGVWRMKIVFVNIYMIVSQDENSWILVDAGLKGSADKIKKMAEQLFGEGTKPSAIVLTHGHFDHVGALEDLLKIWDVPVYAHNLELPYLMGKSSYAPPDPTVSPGLMSLSSWMFPRSPINITGKVKAIAEDETLPGMPEWRVVFTPGHSAGHISLFRNSDRTLIVGDAFVTTKQQSAFYTLLQIKKIEGPPVYFTPDWISAKESVRKLTALKPMAAAAGHGMPMYGLELEKGLKELSDNFEKEAMPDSGRYVNEPAKADEDGVWYVPPVRPNTKFMIIAGAGIALIALAVFMKKKK